MMREQNYYAWPIKTKSGWMIETAVTHRDSIRGERRRYIVPSWTAMGIPELNGPFTTKTAALVAIDAAVDRLVQKRSVAYFVTPINNKPNQMVRQ